MSASTGIAGRQARRVHVARRAEAKQGPRMSTRAALLWVAAASLVIAFALYYPALDGYLVLDDLPLPLSANQTSHPFSDGLSGQRPFLMLSYRLNGWLLGASPTAYHTVNVLIHVINTCLVFLVLRQLLRRAGWGGKRGRVAEFGGAFLFLVHPLQTESVSYIAGRSESLAALFVLLAYVVFLYDRRGGVSWKRALVIMLLFGIAVKTKENAVSLAGILLLTDIMWPRPFSLEGPRRNWRLYALMLPGVVAAAIAALRILATAETAGFSVANFTWYQYAFTEARAIFAYVRMAIAPVGQALDHDFAPSHTIFEHGAALYMALLAAGIVAAFAARRRYPLACFGFLLFLVLLAPTSSVVPVEDALVERRMYLALIGLILIGCEILNRLRPPLAAGLIVVMGLTFCGFCHARNRLWQNRDLLLAQSAANARYNPRPLLNVSEAVIRRGRCDLAIPYLDRAERIVPRSYFVNAIRGRALACLGRLQEGMDHLQLAAKIRPCSEVYQWIGLVYGQMRRPVEAGESLRKAVELNPSSAAAHGSLALWHETMGDWGAAEREYLINIELDKNDPTARAGLERVRLMRRAPAPPSL